MRLQWKMFIMVVASAVALIMVLSLFLGAALKEKDLAAAKRNARQTASLIRSGLLGTMISTGDYDRIANVIADMKKGQNFDFRMVRSEHVIKQHGMKRDEHPKDDLERLALRTGDVIEARDSETRLRIIYPFVTDERCGGCHLGMNGEPVPPGVVNGLAVISFDLSEQARASEEVARKMVFTLALVISLMAVALLVMVYTTVSRPMREIADVVTSFRDERFNVSLPDYGTKEIKIIADAALQTARTLAERKRERERMLKDERERNAEVRKFVRARARDMGLEDAAEVSQIIDRLSSAVDEAEKAELMTKAFRYVHRGESRLILPSDPDIIPAVSLYLGEVVETAAETVKKRSIELALDEALANAIYHGNLEAPSGLKETDFERFNELARQRMTQEPYKSRKVEVTYEFDRKQARFTIRDEGPGFNWRAREAVPAGGEEPHGRGLLIIKALTSKVEFGGKGNEITLTFDLQRRAAAV
ncbi:MAG: ATP-binding protein [Candidatus Nitrospinota bacterium M3_3B_026]